MILLRKQKLVRKVLITQSGGEVKTERIGLPDAALVVTGIKASARQVTASTVEVTTLEYIYGVNSSGEKPTQAELAQLTFAAYQNLKPQFTVSAPTDSGKYIYYAHPSSLSDPFFTFQGFTGGFIDMGTIPLQGPSGVQVFRVWRSTNANLGDNVTVTANHQ